MYENLKMTWQLVTPNKDIRYSLVKAIYRTRLLIATTPTIRSDGCLWARSNKPNANPFCWTFANIFQSYEIQPEHNLQIVDNNNSTISSVLVFWIYTESLDKQIKLWEILEQCEVSHKMTKL